MNAARRVCIPQGGPKAPLPDLIPCRLRAEWEEVDGKAMACSGAGFCLL